jgi:hypothetical protein
LAPVAAAGDLAGWSLACYNPEKDPGGSHARVIVDAVERLFPD